MESLGISSTHYDSNLRKHIERIGNLNTDSLIDIMGYLSLPTADFELKRQFIDESLIARRNRIAHGSYLDVAEEDLINLVSETVSLLRMFKNAVENAVVTDAHLLKQDA
jgi:hypothetical protein